MGDQQAKGHRQAGQGANGLFGLDRRAHKPDEAVAAQGGEKYGQGADIDRRTLCPKSRRNAQRPRRGDGRPRRPGEPACRPSHDDKCQRAGHGPHQVGAPRDLATGQEREQPGQHRKERKPGRVCHTQQWADDLEFAAVGGEDRRRQGDHIQRQCSEEQSAVDHGRRTSSPVETLDQERHRRDKAHGKGCRRGCDGPEDIEPRQPKRRRRYRSRPDGIAGDDAHQGNCQAPQWAWRRAFQTHPQRKQRYTRHAYEPAPPWSVPQSLQQCHLCLFTAAACPAPPRPSDESGGKTPLARQTS